MCFLLWLRIIQDFFFTQETFSSKCPRIILIEDVTHNLGISGVPNGDIWQYWFSSHVCIFCAIMNNLSRSGTSHADAPVSIAHLVENSFTLYQIRPLLKLIVRFFYRKKCRYFWNGENSTANSRIIVSIRVFSQRISTFTNLLLLLVITYPIVSSCEESLSCMFALAGCTPCPSCWRWRSEGVIMAHG